jgi:uncharacterized iron-regulated membrane protein
MVDYTQQTRPVNQDQPREYVRETTVVNTGGSTGPLAALVLLILLGVAGFVFWSADEVQPVNTTAPAVESGAQVNEQAAPADDTARPVPAPDAPLIAPDAAAPAAPDGTASPAPATNG